MSKIKLHIRKMENPLLHFRRRRLENVWCEKYYITIDENEWRIIINSLNNPRNKLIENDRYTDAVDEILIKIVNAPIKKLKLRRFKAMKKTIFEEIGGTYTQVGDYLT